MYNISDAFTTTGNFNEGAGHAYPAGTNVYYTAEGKWDCLAGAQVVSVNGQTGAVTITPDGIGAYTKAEVDARSGVTSVNGATGAVQITTETIGALPTTGGIVNGPLNVGRCISLRTDTEGGNIDIFPPEVLPNFWEFDAFDGNLRIMSVIPDGYQVESFPLTLNRDAAKSWFGGNAATATQANHALTADTATNATAINVESTQNYNTLHSGFPADLSYLDTRAEIHFRIFYIAQSVK